MPPLASPESLAVVVTLAGLGLLAWGLRRMWARRAVRKASEWRMWDKEIEEQVDRIMALTERQRLEKASERPLWEKEGDIWDAWVRERSE